MLHRLLFIAGMTVGVMTPLVWAAYVERSSSHAAPVQAKNVAKPAPAAEITGTITPARPVTSAPQTTVQVAQPPGEPHTTTHASSHRSADTRPRHARQRATERYLPAVVDHYDGAHIIVVCAALTTNEQLRAGCP